MFSFLRNCQTFPKRPPLFTFSRPSGASSFPTSLPTPDLFCDSGREGVSLEPLLTVDSQDPQ